MGRLKGSKNGRLTLVDLTCSECFTSYSVEPHRVSSSRYCSRACKHKGHSSNMKRPTERRCEECGKQFAATPKSPKRFCSFRCSMSYVHRVRKIYRVERGLGVCPMCNSEFQYLPQKPRLGRSSANQIYCSVACADSAKVLPPIEKTCPACAKPYLTKHKDQVFCSNACKCANLGSRRPASDIEILMRKALERSNLEFIEQMPVGYYSLDFALPERRIAIECDGEYWHSFPEARARDKRKDDFLASQGWKVIRFPGSVIKNDVMACLESIKEAA